MTPAERIELLERSQQLSELEGWFEEVRRGGPGRVALIAGEAGIGKTSLVEAFLAAAAPGLVLRGACDPLLTPAPLGALADIAEGLSGRSAELIEGGARPHDVARRLLDELGQLDAVVLVLEDLHWADEGTLDALRSLARRFEHAPALMLVTLRDDELGRAHPLRVALGDIATAPAVRRMKLEPLSPPSVRLLAGSSRVDTDAIHRVTNGNPFYVTEILAAGGSGVPATVSDAVMARVARLDAAARTLLDAIAVVPQAVGLDVLERIAPDTFKSLDECVGAGVIEAERHAVRFRHELARLAVAAAIPPTRRIDLHRLVLAELARRPSGSVDPARLAHHADGAGDAAAIRRYARLAAERAGSLGAHREAAAHYEQALAAEGAPAGERAELLERCAWELYLTNRLTEAVAAAREALALRRSLGERVREGDCQRMLSRYLWFGGSSAAAVEASLEAVAILEQFPPARELAMAYSNRSQLCMLAEDPAGAIEWGSRALELADRLGAEDIRVHALTNIGTAEFNGGLQRGRAKLEESLARAAAAGFEDDVGRAFANLTAIAVTHRSHAMAADYAARGLAYCSEHDINSYEPYLMAWQARLQLDSGRWDDALASAAEVLANPRAIPPARMLALVVQGLVAARRGSDGASAELDAAFELARAADELQRLAPVAAARAEAAWLARDADRVLAATSEAFELALARPQPWWLGELAAWRRRAGAPVEVAAAVAQPFALELAGDPVRAADAWADLGCPYDAALALADAQEEQALRRALAELQRLGAQPAARIVARRLRERGALNIPSGPRRASAANPGDLTPRELDVLALLAEGLRNAEIAERLVVSPRTVDHHISSILRKLGVRDRAQAVATARRLGVTNAP